MLFTCEIPVTFVAFLFHLDHQVFFLVSLNVSSRFDSLEMKKYTKETFKKQNYGNCSKLVESLYSIDCGLLVTEKYGSPEKPVRKKSDLKCFLSRV